jgi:hypothetical protein
MGNPRWPFYPCRRFFEHGFAWNFPILTQEHFSRPVSHAMELLPSFIVSSASITISVMIVCTHYPGKMSPSSPQACNSEYAMSSTPVRVQHN